MVVGSVLDVRRGRRYENFFGIPVPIIPWGHPSLLTAMLIELIHSPWYTPDTLASADTDPVYFGMVGLLNI